VNRTEVLEKVRAKLGDKVLKAEERTPGRIYFTINREDVVPAVDYLVNGLGSRFLITVGTDLRQEKGKFEVIHIFALDVDKLFVSLRILLDPSDAVIDSITPIITGANWAERELHDMLGVEVRGHPDPRRLVLADDWPEGLYPLRKDFPFDFKPESDPNARPVLKAPPEGATVLPVGPFYPVLEEPAYFRLFIESEQVVGCDYRGFYNHRGIEKLGEAALSYNQVAFLAERICGICGNIHSTVYCETVEQAAGITVSRRARFLRSIMLELERIHSHLLWLGIAGHIIGFETLLMQTWRMREPVMWLAEYITGARKTYGMNLVGGVRFDITAEKMPRVLEVLQKVEKELLALVDAIPGDSPLMMRLKDVGFLTNEDARAFCVVGPTARGSGVAIDARIDHPYSAYDELIADKKVHSECDILARTLVRLEETFDSVRLIREGIKGLKEMPEGDLMAKMEGEIPAGREGINVVEAPRGEAIHYVLTGEHNSPARWRVRAPTYPNLQAVPPMIKGVSIADVPISLGSFDPCFSCTERMEFVDMGSGKARVYSQNELVALSQAKGGLRRGVKE
jgi:Ni,Fe-hydrogenase III large subunit/Ni,Fe-hydrogenase III component G